MVTFTLRYDKNMDLIYELALNYLKTIEVN